MLLSWGQAQISKCYGSSRGSKTTQSLQLVKKFCTLELLQQHPAPHTLNPAL